MDARCYNKPAENPMAMNTRILCRNPSAKKFNRKERDTKQTLPSKVVCLLCYHCSSNKTKKGIQRYNGGYTHIVHTHTHLFMNFSKANYTLVPTTMYRYGLKPYGFIFFYSKPHTYKMPHSLTHTSFLFLI